MADRTVRRPLHRRHVDTEELWPRFPRGSQRTTWDYLLEGGHDRHPDRMPAHIVTTRIKEPVEVRGPGGLWELRAVRVRPDEQAPDIPFRDGWPNALRPADARRPLR